MIPRSVGLAKISMVAEISIVVAVAVDNSLRQRPSVLWPSQRLGASQLLNKSAFKVGQIHDEPLAARPRSLNRRVIIDLFRSHFLVAELGTANSEHCQLSQRRGKDGRLGCGRRHISCRAR